MVTVAKFQGGGAFNVIPDSVTIGGTFRAFSKESFLQLKERIEEVYSSTDPDLLSVLFFIDGKPEKFNIEKYSALFSLFFFLSL